MKLTPGPSFGSASEPMSQGFASCFLSILNMILKFQIHQRMCEEKKKNWTDKYTPNYLANVRSGSSEVRETYQRRQKGSCSFSFPGPDPKKLLSRILLYTGIDHLEKLKLVT